MTHEELIDLRDALIGARASGTRRIVTQTAGVSKEVEYRTDAELLAALCDVERRIAGTNTRISYVRSSKGF